VRRALIVAATSIIAGFYLGTPALATEGSQTPGPSFETCKNLTNWYANPDEQGDLPTPTEAGLLFEDRDLIHHAVGGIDLADMDRVNYSFDASTAGKVVFKVETSSPYSTVITNADGKLWSTAMTYDQDGGQGHPVAKYSDLVGKPTKPGKATYTSASMVVTFGVGYWVTEGSTVVSSITFHGKTYPLTCKPPVTTPPTTAPTTGTTTGPTTKPTITSKPTTRPTGSATTSSPAPGGVTTTNVSDGGGLPVTGPSIGWLAAGGALVLAAGGGLAFLARRRKVGFEV